MKVKLFAKYSPIGRKSRLKPDLQDEINAWLEANPAIKIITIKQSATGGSFNKAPLFFSIWYEENI